MSHPQRVSSFILVIVLVTLLVAIGAQVWYNPNTISNAIVDISWPNCDIHPSQQFKAGIIGVTGGLDFRSNPCLNRETSWFIHYDLYMNTGYAGPVAAKKFLSYPLQCRVSDDTCLAYNYGYNAALYAIQYAAIQGAHANMWWLDVETDNSWSDNFLVNRAVLQGAVAAIEQRTLFASVGFYSANDQWDEIVGAWQVNLPAWVGTGGLTETVASNACHENSFTGGPLWLSQYTLVLDKNVPCSPQFMHYVLLL